jgi:LmbE family N-acetylglucosaminyl deacetylase
MHSLSFDFSHGEPAQLLCLGAHSDDIEIGCGGAILALTRRYPELIVHWRVFSASDERRQEALDSAYAFLASVKQKTVEVFDFRDSYFPYEGARVKEQFERLRHEVDPALIFTHWSEDAHQDHRLMCELTRNAFRDHLVLEYEIPKYDGDLGKPNVFLPLEQTIVQQKIELLMAHFSSQRSRYWFSEETFRGLMRLRGVESRAVSGYAEGFFGRKLVVL